MVRIEFLGAWKDKDVQAVRDVTVTGIEKKLKISVLPAYFEEEYSLIEENCLAFSENCMRNKKIAPVECGERCENHDLAVSCGERAYAAADCAGDHEKYCAEDGDIQG